MSNHRQARRAGRRAPIRHATPTRQSASGPGDRIASATEIAGFFREDCRGLDDSLQLEMVVAQYELRMRSVRSSQGAAVGDELAAAVIDELEQQGSPLSHAILRGLAHLARGETARRSADAAARLAEADIGLPVKFGDVAGAQPTAAWRATEGAHTGEYVLFVEFEHSLGRRHTIAVFVEPRRGGTIKHIGLLDAMTAIEGDGPFDPRAMDALDYATAGALLSAALERTYGEDVADSDDYRVLIAAARARSLQRDHTAQRAA
jgi:hypothetical protein